MLKFPWRAHSKQGLHALTFLAAAVTTVYARITPDRAYFAVVARQSVDAKAVQSLPSSISRFTIPSPRKGIRRYTNLIRAWPTEILHLPIFLAINARNGSINVHCCLLALPIVIVEIANKGKLVRIRGPTHHNTECSESQNNNPAGSPPARPHRRSSNTSVQLGGPCPTDSHRPHREYSALWQSVLLKGERSFTRSRW